MKIERTKYEEAYRCGQKVHAGKMGITNAMKRLQTIGLNPISAAYLVYGVKHMLNGHRYTRTLNASVTSDFLTWIERDYNKIFLQNAVSALRQHIEYYQSLTKTPMTRHVKILEKYTTLLDNDMEDFISPEEIAQSEGLVEGTMKTITVNVYERNPKARKECIEHFKCICSVCELDFEKIYGAIGKGFIHVHHLKDLASIGKSYTVNPKEDLRPVCPNCHAMLHKSKPPYSTDELKKLMAAQRNA